MIKLIIKAIEHIKAKTEKKDKIEKQAVIKFGICPYCNTGEVFVNERGYGCTKWEETCKFFITKTYLGVNIEFDYIKRLCEDGETDFIEGFQGKQDKFTTALVANKINRKIDFKYEK